MFSRFGRVKVRMTIPINKADKRDKRCTLKLYILRKTSDGDNIVFHVYSHSN